MFGSSCRIHGGKGGKALFWDELTGVLGRLSARQACTWRPNTLWNLQKHFSVDVLGWQGKEVFRSSQQLMSKAGRERAGRPVWEESLLGPDTQKPDIVPSRY